MGVALGKLGSIGVGSCPCHPPLPPVTYNTIISTGAPTVNVNGVSAAIIGSVGISSCGHATVALTGSACVIANGQGLHRTGDIGANCGNYILLTGAVMTNSG